MPGPLSQEREGCCSFPPASFLSGSCPDDVRDQQTKALFSCPCAEDWPRLPRLSHLPSEDDQMMSHTSRLRGTQETPLAGALAVPAHPDAVCPCGLRGGGVQRPGAHIQQRRQSARWEALAYAGGHVLPQSSSVTAWCEIRFLSAIDLTQRR